MNFNFDSMLGSVGVYVVAISALAFGVERIMDLFKTFARKWFVAETARKDMNEEDRVKYADKEDARQRRVRIWAIPFGLVLAFVCEIDTFELLGIDSPMWGGMPILGYVVSGLAASRGSAFWHDIVELVRGIREERGKRLDAKRRGEVEA